MDLGTYVQGKSLKWWFEQKIPLQYFYLKHGRMKLGLKEIKCNLDFKNLFFVERNNRGGGLALYWRDSIDLNIDTFSNTYIDAIINKGKEDEWRLTRFYG